MAEEKASSYRGFTEAQARAHKKYISRFVEVKIRMDSQRRDVIKAHAAKQDGGSVNAFINRAIDNQMERDNSAAPTDAEQSTDTVTDEKEE